MHTTTKKKNHYNNNNNRTNCRSQFLRHLEEIYQRELLQQQQQQQQQQALYLSASELDQEIAMIMNVGTPTTTTAQTDFANFANFDSPEALEIAVDNTSGFKIFTDDSQDDDEGEDNTAAAAAATTIDMPLPEPFSPSNQQQQRILSTSEDVSNDTPTTCNRSLLTPTKTPQQQKQRRDDGDNNTTTDGRPPKHILHQSLSLGDALSPADDDNDSPSAEQPRQPQQQSKRSSKAQYSDDYFSPSSSTGEDELKLKHLLQIPTMEELSSRRSLVPVNEETAMEDGIRRRTELQSHSITTKLCTENTNPLPPPPPLKDDDSFSTVSSFTVGPNINQKQNNQVVQDQQPRPNPPPFFWKTHPSVTMKSNQPPLQQQLKPRMRHVVPNLKRVGTIDSYSTFGGSNDAVRINQSSTPSTSSSTSSSMEDGMWIDSKPYKIHEQHQVVHQPKTLLQQQQVTTKFQEARNVANSVFSSIIGGGPQHSFGRQNYY